MKSARIPERQCLGCRVHKPKSELCRVVRPPEGSVILDRHGKAQGRGAYLCRNAECLRRVRKSRALERMLKVPVPSEIYDLLEEQAEPTEAKP